MKTSEFLRQAKALIDTPEKWIQGFPYGIRVGSGPYAYKYPMTGEKANCFCSMGAIREIWNTKIVSDDVVINAMDNLQAQMHHVITYFNDTRTHESVMEAWDKAIESAEKDDAPI